MTATTIPEGAFELSGTVYMHNAKGELTPISMIKAADLLMDETVRKLMRRATALSAELAAFKTECFAELQAFNDVLDQEYEAKRGGAKGNVTFNTFDGLLKISVQIADRLVFGPELQVAKKIIDECLLEWAEGGRVEIRTIVMRAFRVDKEGQVNKSELFGLLQLELDDERWKRAMQAIRDSMRVDGTKAYVRFHTKSAPDAEPRAVSLDIAKL